MTYDDLIAYYGSTSAVAAAIGTYPQKVQAWRLAVAGVPLADQIDIEILTGGKLRADVPAKFRRMIGKNHRRNGRSSQRKAA